MAFVERGRGGRHLVPMIECPDVAGWTDAVALDAITDHRGIVVSIKGTEIALMREGDRVFGVGNLCPHRGGQIGDGTVRDGKAICPLHLWDFDLRTGISPFDPNDSIPTYPVRVTDGRVEVDADQVPRGPGRPDAYLGRWTRRGATDRGMYVVHHLSDGLGPFVEAMGSDRLEPSVDRGRRYLSLDDLVFKPSQLDRFPLLDDVPVDTTVELGTRAAQPLKMSIPLLVSHMSFGALSREAKIALAAGAKAAGTAMCSGEGGIHPDELAAAGTYIFEMASGYFGWTEESISKADAIEVKIGQGAKPGLGGLLPGAKVTPEIAAVRHLPPGEDAHSPARFRDISSLGDLRARVDWIRSVNPGAPIGIKFAAGNVEADCAAALDAGADYLIVDGLGGGTGAAPVHVKDHVGVPSFMGLYRAARWLEDHGVDDVQIVSTGGYRTPVEMAKGLALGADAIALATSSLMAIGCQQYRACHRGSCPVGIATQQEHLRARLDPNDAAPRLTTFLQAATDIIVDFCRITGHQRVAALARTDLASLHPDLAAATDIDFVL
jgi:glutamate synthase domain-containing protein 2/nitrite reductase/ring-hydroxylating ferredoxin subunit